MNKFPKLIFLIFISLSIRLSSQSIKGKVIDADNSIELNKVQIVDTASNISTSTNANGSFTISGSGVYTFSKDGFFLKTLTVSNTKFIVVELKAQAENLNEILIRTSNFQTELKTLASAVSLISSKVIESNNSVNIAPILNTVSGVFMQNGTLNTNRITIRGIGSRNLYGTSKIRAYYQDIPLTNGSGESTVEDIELKALGRIEILKGPSSSLYGAGLGGTIQMIPNKGQMDQVSLKSGYTFGSSGLQKFLVESNLGNKTNSANIIYSNTTSDGYRDNNELDRQIITLATNHFFGDSDKITLIGNYIDLKAFIPSSLNEYDYQNNPESAARTWGRSKGYEDYKKGLFGLSWQHDYDLKTKQITSVFTSFLDSYEPRPFNILKEQTNALGLRSRIISENQLFTRSLKWTVGGEIFSDRNLVQTYENLYQDFPPETGSVQGDILSDFKENRTYFNLFIDSKYHLSKRSIISFGLNFNQTFYRLDDRFITDDIDFSGDYYFDAIFSPKIGLTYKITNSSMIYASISHGFSPPTLNETLLPDGMINTYIKPESGWNYEIGSRGNFLNKIFTYDLALYRMDVKNLLVAQRTSNDEFIGVNAGETQYKGIEFTLNYPLIKSNTFHLIHTNSMTYNDFKFKEFIHMDNDYSGNQLTGIPNFTFNSSLNFEANSGFYGLINYNFVNKIPMRDDNSIFSEKYQLVNTKIGYRSSENKKVQFEIFVGINNIFDEKYASMLLINAGSFGNKPPRYYYPGEPVNYYSGMNLKYIF